MNNLKEKMKKMKAKNGKVEAFPAKSASKSEVLDNSTDNPNGSNSSLDTSTTGSVVEADEKR